MHSERTATNLTIALEGWAELAYTVGSGSVMTQLLVLTSNCCGVLARITSIVSASGINIHTAAAYPIGDSELSVVHLRIGADQQQAERMRRKIGRLVDVIEARTEQEMDGGVVHLGILQGAVFHRSAPAGAVFHRSAPAGSAV